MLVSEAIKILSTADPDAELIMSSDEEGNSYRYAAISLNEYADLGGDGISAIAEEDIADSEDEIDEYHGPVYLRSDLSPVVVIW